MLRSILVVVSLVLPIGAMAVDASPEATALMKRVNDRAEPVIQKSKITFRLLDHNDREQERTATALTKTEEDSRRMAMYFHSPRAMRGSAFLALDMLEEGVEDSQWLYLPTLRRVRRVPARERGKAFLGTDLSYDDIRRPAKAAMADWVFTSATPVEGSTGQVKVEGVAVSDDIAEETGYGRAEWLIDEASAFILEVRSWDPKGDAYKHAVFEEIVEHDGVLIAEQIKVENLKTGHRTYIRIDDIELGVEFDDALVTESGLARGL